LLAAVEQKEIVSKRFRFGLLSSELDLDRVNAYTAYKVAHLQLCTPQLQTIWNTNCDGSRYQVGVLEIFQLGV
jgi:hypothetical protein